MATLSIWMLRAFLYINVLWAVITVSAFTNSYWLSLPFSFISGYIAQEISYRIGQAEKF